MHRKNFKSQPSFFMGQSEYHFVPKKSICFDKASECINYFPARTLYIFVSEEEI